MFVSIDEMKSAIYEYQLNEITENDDTIVETAINSATEQVKSYFTVNSKTDWNDGRPMYDADAIFSATGTDRNSLLLSIVKSITKWWIIELSNVDIIEEKVKERYDRNIKYLREIQSGSVSISTLPTLDPTTNPALERNAFRSGSRPKFNHY